MTTYSCFSESGETPLPDKHELQSCIQKGIEPTLFIDSCVCLHIIKVVDYGKKASNVDLQKIIGLKEYLSHHPIKLSPFFGLLELCLRDGRLDKSKLEDFKCRIDFYEQIQLKEFKKFKYDFNSDYLIFKTLGDLPELPEAFESLQMNTYCALLKIRSIAKRGLTKERAEQNLIEFFDWMVNDLDIVRGMEYLLALNIFGGFTEYRKMIGLDCKPTEIKKRLIGTCWDIFHAKTTSNSFRLFEMFQKNFTPYFLTSDANLFKLARELNLKLIKDGGDNFTTSFLLNSVIVPPHYRKEFLELRSRKMMDTFVDRRNKVYEFDEVKVAQLVRELEIDNLANS